MATKDENLASCLGMLVYAAIFSPLTAILYGWTLAKLWMWFVIPVFHLPPLGIGYAIGLAWTVRFVTYQSDAAAPKDPNKSAWEILVGDTVFAIALCVTTLGFSYILKQFI